MKTSTKKTNFKGEKDENLHAALATMREEVRAWRFGAAGSAPRDVSSLRANKKNIARVLTELNVRKRRAAYVLHSGASS